MDKTKQGHSFEYRLAQALSQALSIPVSSSDILLRREKASNAFGIELPKVAKLQDIAAGNLAARFASNVNGDLPTSVSITDGSPDDLRVQKASGNSTLISVKWTDGVKENRGPRIGTGTRGEYQRDLIFGLPTDGLWRRVIDDIDTEIQEHSRLLTLRAHVDKKTGKVSWYYWRDDYPEDLFSRQLTDLADVTHWQFSKWKNNPEFASRLVRSIYGNLDVVYASAGQKNLDGTLRLIKSFSGGSCVSCERHNLSTVITVAENASKRRVEFRHRVKVKEAHKMNGRVSDYCYNIRDDQGAVFQL